MHLSEMHLRQSGFTYSAYEPFYKENKKVIQKFKETGDLSYIYQKEIDNTCFKKNISCDSYKDLIRRTASYKVLRHKAFSVASNSKYDGYQRGLASVVYIFDKKS